MGEIANEIVRLAFQEWETFGRSTRSLANQWHIGGNESDPPYRGHITRYWASVGHPDWDGGTPEPWSGAFISWCFETAQAGDSFTPSSKHSRYIDRIRRHDGMSELLRLRPPTRSIVAGDLIWNSRGNNAPASHEAAIERLQAQDFFISHVDIVVAVRPGECDSIGGNVHPDDDGGSVVRSTWRLDAGGALADPRKIWIGVIKNGL